MTGPGSFQDDFDRLLSAFCDQHLDRHELAQFNRLLRSHPEAYRGNVNARLIDC